MEATRIVHQSFNRRMCLTRGMKNAKYLQAVAPTILPKNEPAAGFGSLIDPALLNVLHVTRPDQAPAIASEPAGLSAFLASHSIPGPAASVAGSLFNGTVYFVQISFTTPQGVITISDADMAVAVSFASRASLPISRYASQFGKCSVTIDQNVIAYAVDLQSSSGGNSYNDQTLQGWVNDIASRNNLANGCIAVLNPPGVMNTDATGGVLGYHAQSNLPYIFGNVQGQNFSLQDGADDYALVLSHELAEMTVDPAADLSNPEVCDGCGPNCQSVFRDYFDASNVYVGTSQDFPPSFAFAYFINAIVQPSSATQCPAPSSACAYPPPDA
ncbi:MAG: hypothetical protein JO343_10880, partial [Candidatus Eremiobacteraeota bacterium]|nr:hypothetical protein [Candidatus Eremiobacteraeota bacterium]